MVEKCSIPAFQKLEEFQNRLSEQTHVALVNKIAKLGVELNIADPSKFDIDSTVQEAIMNDSADGSLLQKLAKKIQLVFLWLSNPYCRYPWVEPLLIS